VYGLAIDNVVEFELVLPDGTVTTVTEDDHDLWFALRVRGGNILISISLAKSGFRVAGTISWVIRGSSH